MPTTANVEVPELASPKKTFSPFAQKTESPPRVTRNEKTIQVFNYQPSKKQWTAVLEVSAEKHPGVMHVLASHAKENTDTNAVRRELDFNNVE